MCVCVFLHMYEYMGAHLFADPRFQTHLMHVHFSVHVSYPCFILLVEAHLFNIFAMFCKAPQIVFAGVFLGRGGDTVRATEAETERRRAPSCSTILEADAAGLCIRESCPTRSVFLKPCVSYLFHTCFIPLLHTGCDHRMKRARRSVFLKPCVS